MRSVDNESESHAIELRKAFRGSLCFLHTRGRVTVSYWSDIVVLPESDWNMCKRTIVVPQELERTLFAPRRIPGRRYRVNQLQALAAHSSARERKQRVQPRYRQTKETKCGGMAAGRHSVLIVPMKLANSSQLEPVEGSETSDHGTVLEKHDECLEIRQACPRNRSG